MFKPKPTEAQLLQTAIQNALVKAHAKRMQATQDLDHATIALQVINARIIQLNQDLKTLPAQLEGITPSKTLHDHVEHHLTRAK